jgi:hypothetical protein
LRLQAFIENKDVDIMALQVRLTESALQSCVYKTRSYPRVVLKGCGLMQVDVRDVAKAHVRAAEVRLQ